MGRVNLLKLYEQLYAQFGPQHWWPVFCNLRKVDARFEICVGAVLTQNTAWTNVEKAIANLVRARLLDPSAICRAPLRRLKAAIRPAGYFNQKAKKLRIFSEFVLRSGGLDKLFRKPCRVLRAELLERWGIGPETADSIILYAAKKPVFVIDAYTKRWLAEKGVVLKDYEEYRSFFEKNMPRSVKLWNEYHALIVAWAKTNREKKKGKPVLARL